MSYQQILEDIRQKMEGIAGIGVVHNYQRWSADWKKFLQHFAYTPEGSDQQEIRGWTISRAAALEHLRGAYFRHHIFKLRGYMGLKDDAATEVTFQELIEDICDMFRSAEPVDPAANWYYLYGDEPDEDSAQAEVIDIRIFGGTLCHYAELTVHCMERIVPTM